MKERLKRKWFFSLLSLIMLTTVALAFTTVYELEQVTVFYFIGILALVCFIPLLIKSTLIQLPFYILIYCFGLYLYFPLQLSFGITWYTQFIQQFLDMYLKIQIGEINYLPPICALSIILFLLILLAILFVQYEHWLLGYLLLVIYLLMLAVFNRLNFSNHVLALTSAAVLFYAGKQVPNILNSKKSWLLLFTILLLTLSFSSSYLFLNAWPQSKTFLFNQTAPIRNYLNRQGLYQKIDQYGFEGYSRTGFSEDDTELGGPLADDQTILFTAKQSSKHYWRVETKTYYSGKGWQNTDKTTTPNITGEPLEINTYTDFKGTLKESSLITLNFKQSSDFLPYPYGNSSIPYNEIGQTEVINENNRVVMSEPPESIQLTWQEPDFSKKSLALVPYQFSQDQETTQLPSTLANRIQDLAVELTSGQETLYDKVKAIETYLKTDSGFRYSKADTPYTPKDEEYVDYFLFESKVGYCDNFSSAMTVLLRSIGIPSRWAKGFISGELTDSSQAEYQEYTIRNSDAHSWPEVYFEGYGWVPFEPTPGFVTAVDADINTSNSTQNSDFSSSSTIESTTQSDFQESTVVSTRSTENSEKVLNKERTNHFWMTLFRIAGWGISIILLVVCAYFLKKYFFLLNFTIYRKLQPRNFTGAYVKLLRKAERLLPRQANEPLNLYAERFEQEYPLFNSKFIHLTEAYEYTLYSSKKTNIADYNGLLTFTAHQLTAIKK